MLELIIISFGAFYFIVAIFISIGIFRLPKSIALEDAKLPTVSVIVSAKNEEQDLPKCIASLEQLDYPKDKFQILLVDDSSTDNTGSIIQHAAQKNDHFVALSTKDAATNNLKAKARGIAWGFKNSSSDWVFITDADAEVPTQWLRHMLSLVNEKTGIIGGMLVVNPTNFVAILERVSWAFTLPYAFGMAGWGSSFICIGPNMGIRRSIYDDFGGLENATFNVAEDLALFRMVEESGYKSLSYVTPQTTVKLNPVISLKHLWSQQRRWLKGGFEGGWKYGIGLVFAFGLLSIFSFVQFTGLFYAFEATIILISLIISANFLMTLSLKMLIKRSILLRLIPLQWLYLTFTLIWLPLSVLFSSKIRWRGEGYEIKYDK